MESPDTKSILSQQNSDTSSVLITSSSDSTADMTDSHEPLGWYSVIPLN